MIRQPINSTTLTRSDFMKELLCEVQAGRNLVPLTGAGISVDAGVPTLASLTDYLARVRIYLVEKLYRPTSPGEFATRSSADARVLLSRNAREYLNQFGWPDPNLLTATVWQHLLNSERFSKTPPSRRMVRAIEDEILNSLEKLDQRMVEHLRVLTLRQEDALHLQGDHWRHLLLGLTRNDPDLTDSLFRRLVNNKEPASAHRYLAFLAPPLGIRLFLTYNFDPFIENALNREGIPVATYDVAGEAALPSPQLLQESRSVVKLHGTRFRLVADSRVQRPLDVDSRDRLSAYLPDQPVLLVLGIGGWEERVLDAVDLALRKEGTVFWLHFQDPLPEPVADRWGNHRSFRSCRGVSPAGFLQEFYERRCRSHPSIRRSYSAYGSRPVPISTGQGNSEARDLPLKERVFADKQGDLGFGASFKMAQRVTDLSGTHSPIWIDLESKHSIADVMADLIRQIRRYDPAIPPEIIPMERALPTRSGLAEKHYQKAIRRLLVALGRGKYVIAFDGISAFGRPPTWHHGINKGDWDRADQELEFLNQLERAASSGKNEGAGEGEIIGPRDSIFLYSFGARRERFDKPINGTYPPLLTTLFGVASNEEEKLPECIFESDAQGFLLGSSIPKSAFFCFLSAFRTRHSHVAITTIGKNFIFPADERETPGNADGEQEVSEKFSHLKKGEQEVFEKLDALKQRERIRPTEDGSWLMPRSLRNVIRERFTEAVRRTELIKAVANESRHPPSDRQTSLDYLASVHHALAVYFTDLAACSSDPKILFEALYHRISTLRYLTKLQLCLSKKLIDSPTSSSAWYLRKRLPQLFSWKVNFEEALKCLRQELLHSLTHLLLANSDLLRAMVPAPSTLNWLHWFATRDCHRFSLMGWYKNDPLSTRDADLEESDCSMIEGEILRLKRHLLYLENRVETDRMNLVGSLDSAARWFSTLQESSDLSSSVGVIDRKDWSTEDWLKWCRHILAANDISAINDWDPSKFRMLFAIAQACLKSGRKEEAEALSKVLSQKTAQLRADGTRGNSLFGTEALAHRVQAELCMINISPWDAKGQDLKSYREALESAKEAERHVNLAIHKLGATSQTPSSTLSYLQSLKGRALAVQGNFPEAYRLFDQSRAGLDSLPSHSRHVRAISLLRLAECVLLRADDALLPKIRTPSEKHLSKKWRDQVAKEQNINETDILDLLGQSISNWSNDALEDQEDIEQRIFLARARLSRVQDLLRSAERVLDRTRRSVEWWACLFQLQAQLEVERLLLLTVEVSRFRQLEEELQKGLNTNARTRENQEDRVAKESRHLLEKETRFANRLHSSLLAGLLGVRRGLDVLLPDENERDPDELRSDRRVNRMLRLWLELMVCGADLTLRLATKNRRPNADKLWKLTGELNHTAGLWKLPNTDGVKNWLDKWLDPSSAFAPKPAPPAVTCPPLEPLPSRARLIEQIDICLSKDSGCLSALHQSLVLPART